MPPSAGGSRPCPRLRTLPHRFRRLAPPGCKHAAATRRSSAPTPAARTTRRCPFPVRCAVSVAGVSWDHPACACQHELRLPGLLQLCRATLRFPPARPRVPLLLPPSSAVAHCQTCHTCSQAARGRSRVRIARACTAAGLSHAGRCMLCVVRVACRMVLGAWCRLLIACCTVHVDCWLLGRPCMLYVVVACCVLSFHSVARNACYRFILWQATLHDMQRAVLHVSCLPKLVVARACCMVHGSSHVARAE
jgi:hypothetical protein